MNFGNVPIVGGYALFKPVSEEYAIARLQEAYSHVRKEPIRVTGFNKDGDVVIERGVGKPKSESNHTVRLERNLSDLVLSISIAHSQYESPDVQNALLVEYLAIKY